MAGVMGVLVVVAVVGEIGGLGVLIGGADLAFHVIEDSSR